MFAEVLFLGIACLLGYPVGYWLYLHIPSLPKSDSYLTALLCFALTVFLLGLSFLGSDFGMPIVTPLQNGEAASPLSVFVFCLAFCSVTAQLTMIRLKRLGIEKKPEQTPEPEPQWLVVERERMARHSRREGHSDSNH
ncbi:hypothetical protein J2T60_002352 [Natronospira proteinivora]|uniref:Uncharacterized protein n=1 Tax=Natronospira proteinivora TaxID=1807133 RepID=A0ABT1GBB5_9GAMM|nr:hypothetical protein [Natronospira proteinivora]MCP1728352.1 hypothetical protein [Natronospira proteinivora]